MPLNFRDIPITSSWWFACSFNGPQKTRNNKDHHRHLTNATIRSHFERELTAKCRMNSKIFVFVSFFVNGVLQSAQTNAVVCFGVFRLPPPRNPANQITATSHMTLFVTRHVGFSS